MTEASMRGLASVRRRPNESFFTVLGRRLGQSGPPRVARACAHVLVLRPSRAMGGPQEVAAPRRSGQSRG